jgi:pyroglutamyl-peptidase
MCWYINLSVPGLPFFIPLFPQQIYSSMDAGHYVCDFAYYCSLAEAKRAASKSDKGTQTKVLFMHCPPVDQPFSTEEVIDAVKKIIVWVCTSEH